MKKLLLVVFLLLIVNAISAQISYSFSASSGSYTANSGATAIGSAYDDDVLYGAQNIGFSFTYGCTTYTQFRACSNGWMALGSSASSNSYSNDLTTTGQGPILAPLWDDLSVDATGGISFVTTGTAPNRVLTVEWSKMQWYYSAGGPVISFQVKLYENGNTISFVYKQESTAASNPSASIGINGGTSSTDYYSLNGTGASPTANYNSQTSTLSTRPANGQVYSWSPNSMTYTSCTTAQPNTATVTKCDIDQDIIQVQVVTGGGCLNVLTATSFSINCTGTTNITNDISRIHIYYTGTSSTFNATNELVSGGTAPAAGTIVITGSQALSAGTNYFWIAYDINSAATTGDVVDAQCTQITVGGVNRTPTTTSPAGTRSIVACSLYPGTSALNLKHWVKSDAGVTGSPVSAWADQSGAGITGNMAQATAGSRPTIQSSAINFQDYLRFDGVDDILVSANTFTGTSLFNATDNTIFMVKNIKSGIVDYKWETAPTGSYRVGEELNGSAQRIDFSDDITGKNGNSTTAITNKDVIVGFVSDATSLTLKLNANVDAAISQANTFAPGSTTKPLNIGSNDLGNPLYCNVDIAEVMTFNKKLNASEMRRVESYLCIKYGITLGNNKGSAAALAYMESDGTQIWNNHTGYHNYVIGLGRDNTAGNSLLNKLKTTSVSSLNGSTDIVTLANGSLSAPTSITNDKTFLMSGSNAGTLATPIQVFQTHNGPATVIAYQLSRVWATQKTGTLTGNVIIQFDVTQINGPSGYGTNINADLRLLVDDDASFYNGSAGEHTYSPNAGYTATGGTVNFTVPYSDIQSGTGYYTLGSVNIFDGTLPVELTDFKANCLGSKTEVSWSTATETNNDHFDVLRSANGVDYALAARVSGHGTSLQAQHYSAEVSNETETSFFKLTQVDRNGKQREYAAVTSVCKTSVPVIAPNPFNGSFMLSAGTSAGDVVSYTLYNNLGQLVLHEEFTCDENMLQKTVEAPAKGIFYLTVDINGKSYRYKLVSQ